MANDNRHIFFLFTLLLLLAGDVFAFYPKVDTLYRDSIITRRIVRDVQPMRIGLEGSGGLNLYSNTTLPFPLNTGCDTFLSGQRFAPAFGVRIELPLDDEFYLAPNVSYQDLGGRATFGEIFQDTVSVGGEVTRVLAPFEHRITTKTKALGIGAMFGWNVASPLFLEAGVEALFLFGNSFDKVLSATGTGGFSDGSRDSLELTGDLPQAKSFLPSVSFTLGAEFPLSSKLTASPNVSIRLPIGGTTDYFSHYTIRGGLMLRYDIGTRRDTIEEIERIRIAEPIFVQDTQPKKPRLAAQIEAVGRNKDGSEEKVILIEVKDVKARIAFPFLNYVFFDEGSAAIPSRYVTYVSAGETEKFKGTSDRQSETILSIYYEMLNFLGARLKTYPRTTITITGSTANVGTEQNDLSLARKRAESVKNYLVKVWQVAPERLKTEARLLPEHPSPVNHLAGQAENRRVEITSSDERITDPIIVTNTEHTANPPDIKLQPRITRAGFGIKHLLGTVSIGGIELLRREGDIRTFSAPKAYTITEQVLSRPEDSLDLYLFVEDSGGNTAMARGTIPFSRHKTVSEKQEELERYSLILFGFDEDDLGTKNERTISLVAEALKKTTVKELKIIGYTDESGNAEYNDDLSRRRAHKANIELEKALQKRSVLPPPKKLIDGRGAREKLYDNSLPEGRFFSRTVNITIEK